MKHKIIRVFQDMFPLKLKPGRHLVAPHMKISLTDVKNHLAGILYSYRPRPVQ